MIKPTSRIVLALCALLWVSFPLSAHDKKGSDFVGEYTVVGSDGETDYSGTVKITAHADAYKITWKFVDGTGEEGIGIVDGNSIAICFVADDGHKGVVVYKKQTDKTLLGSYAIMGGDGKVSHETLTRVASAKKH